MRRGVSWLAAALAVVLVSIAPRPGSPAPSPAPADRVFYAAPPMTREPGPERLARPQVRDTQVLLTVLAGRETYRAKGF